MEEKESSVSQIIEYCVHFFSDSKRYVRVNNLNGDDWTFRVEKRKSLTILKIDA